MVLEPHERIKNLASYGNSVDVNPNTPIKRYYRSGNEMVKMAKVYQDEGSYENAYILYIKFMTLFVEKIRSHPEYKSVPADIKQPNTAALKQIMPTCEKLKVILLDRYRKEYDQYLLDKKKAEKELEARKAKEAKEKAERNDSSKFHGVVINQDQPQPTAPPDLNQVMYPNDFPPEPNRSSLLPTSLQLPDVKPGFDRTLKPSPSNSLLEGLLRSVVIPKNLMDRFLSLATQNTVSNIETCGILAGKLANHKFIITHVIVPKQKGTSDSCTTMSEEEIFIYQDRYNLITLGWIHTHPSQTAFLSSVDLHTHFSYQTMLDEAIAIVCSPKYNTTGFFCLTPNYGLDYIAQCRQTGFHPHPNDPPLFMDAQHVCLDDSNVEIIDLR